jgi:aldehyde dehydrogenase (NAD+)
LRWARRWTLPASAQAWAGQVHLESTITAARAFHWEEQQGTTLIIREGIGVCGLITPWNWPMNQIACKVAPALVAGCTMVLKPSEIAPLSGLVWAEIMHEAGTPPGVFNLVNGTGPEVGQVLASHPEVDMVSFTGSTRAGIQVAQAAAPTVKRVAQELGGKSANIILPGCRFRPCRGRGCGGLLSPTAGNPATRRRGCWCRAPDGRGGWRWPPVLPPRRWWARPRTEDTVIGPVVSRLQWDKIQRLIGAGIDEGARWCRGTGQARGAEPRALRAAHGLCRCDA